MSNIKCGHLVPSNYYSATLFSDRVVEVMKKGNMLAAGTPADMLAELMRRLMLAERSLGESEAIAERALTEFYDYIRNGQCVLGSPLITNIAAGHKALASCSAIPVRTDRLSNEDLDLAEAYYKLNVGSGYNLSDSKDPCESLLLLNTHAAQVESSNICERYVGNIAHVSVRHPKVMDFVKVKTRHNDVVHFNTSIDIDDEFMAALADDRYYESDDGSKQRSSVVWDAMVDAAWQCGDPGIISLERYNAGNALASQSPYVTTAPCAEVGLAQGESCVFGYVNLAACIRTGRPPSMDLGLIGAVARCLTRVLDDALELSIRAFPDRRTQAVMLGKRKIGIGICGFADALMWLGIDYGSELSVQMLADVLATINFESKKASMGLSRKRGPFLAFSQSAYVHSRSFLERFSRIPSIIPIQEWNVLSHQIAMDGLRHVMTTALPPSGRSALLCDVNPSLEPFLALRSQVGDWVTPVAALISDGYVLVTNQGLAINAERVNGWPACVKTPTSLFRTSTQIAPGEHFRVLGTAAGLVDDGVSKTINLRSDASRATVDEIFHAAWTKGLKAISVYRDGSRKSG